MSAGNEEKTSKAGDGARSIAVNSAYLAAARLGTYVVRALYVLLIARLLGPEMYGVFAYGQAWYLAFFPLALLGLGALIGREVGREPGDGPGEADRTLSITLSLRMIAALVSAVAAALIGWHLESSALYRHVVLAFSLALAGRAMAVWAEHLFIAHERSRYALGQEALFRPLELVLGVALLLSGAGIQTLALLHAAVWWLQAIVAISVVQTRLRRVRPLWELRQMAAMLRQTLPIAAGLFLANWLTQGPLVLYRHVPGVTQTELGQIALPLQLVALLSAIPWSIALAALPVLARSSARADRKDIRFIDLSTRLTVLGGGFLGITGMAFAQPLIETVFGVSYSPAGGHLGPALWLIIPLSIGTITSQALVARGQFRSILFSALIGCITLVGSLRLLAGGAGATGVIVAAGISLSLWACLLYALLHKNDRDGITQALLRPLLVVGAALMLFILLDSIDTRVAFLVVALSYIPFLRLSGAVGASEWARLTGRLRRR